MYDCQYYAYERHPLSELCDTILKDYESLSLSKHLKQLLDYSSENETEMDFAKKLLSSIKFQKVDIDEALQRQSTTLEKKKILKKMADSMKCIKQMINDSIHYHKDVKKEVKESEAFWSAFHECDIESKQRIKGFLINDFNPFSYKITYTPIQKRRVKRQILSTLPHAKQIPSDK